MSYFSPAELQAMAQAGVTPPPITEQMLSYCRLHYALIFAGFLYSVATLWGLLQSGVVAKIDSWCRARLKWKVGQVIAFTFVLATLIAVIRFPFSYYASYFLDHSYGLSQQSFPSWLGDLAKGKAVDALINGLAFSVSLAIIDRFPKRWPYLLWCALMPLVALGIFVAPLLIDPLFNKFTELTSGPQKDAIQSIAVKAGIGNAPIFVVNKSKQTRKLNAYVTGLGSSTRIVIWDNTLTRLPVDQIQAIVAHETGHYVLGHITLGFCLVGAGLMALLLFAQKIFPAVLRRIPSKWGITELTQPGAIAVFMLIGVIGSFVFAPIDNSISRAMERQADEFGLRITQNPPAMARVFVSLSEQNLSEPAPPPFIQFWFYSHPSLRDRIMSALGLP